MRHPLLLVSIPTNADPLVTGLAELSAMNSGRLVGAVPLQAESAKDTASGAAGIQVAPRLNPSIYTVLTIRAL